MRRWRRGTQMVGGFFLEEFFINLFPHNCFSYSHNKHSAIPPFNLHEETPFRPRIFASWAPNGVAAVSSRPSLQLFRYYICSIIFYRPGIFWTSMIFFTFYHSRRRQKQANKQCTHVASPSNRWERRSLLSFLCPISLSPFECLHEYSKLDDGKKRTASAHPAKTVVRANECDRSPFFTSSIQCVLGQVLSLVYLWQQVVSSFFFLSLSITKNTSIVIVNLNFNLRSFIIIHFIIIKL